MRVPVLLRLSVIISLTYPTCGCNGILNVFVWYNLVPVKRLFRSDGIDLGKTLTYSRAEFVE